MLFRYDYGGGSLTAFVWANSVEEVLSVYPQLEYLPDFPVDYPPALRDAIAEKETYVLGQVAGGWLSKLMCRS